MSNDISLTEAADTADLTLPKLKNAPTKPRRMAREQTAEDPGTNTPKTAEVLAPATPRVTKSATVLALLQRDQGAALAELIQATGWLPHSTRAALTGLRKKGHAIERGSRDGVTFYHLPIK